MDQPARTFILEKTRSKNGMIVDAIGKIGTWPFRRTISYNAGVNCDSIAVVDGRLRVQRRGRCLAVAELIGTRSMLRRLLPWT
jgi:hypothetical protein